MVDYTRPDRHGNMPILPHVATILSGSATLSGTSNFINDEAERLGSEFMADLDPQGAVSRFLVRRAATLAARLDRLARYEAATVALRVRRAENEFVQNRLTEVDHLHSWIMAEPATYARRLRQSPEGIDRMLETWRGLRDEIADPTYPRWDSQHRHVAEALTGHRGQDFPTSAIHVWSEAFFGYSSSAVNATPELAGLDQAAGKELAIEKLTLIIDAEIDSLNQARSALDLEAIEQDRLEAADRASHDPSPTANQARRYEIATERGLFQALRMVAKLKKSDQPEAEVEFNNESEPDLEPTDPTFEPEQPPRKRSKMATSFQDPIRRSASNSK